MYKNFENVNDKFAGGNKLAPLAASKQRSVAVGNKVMDTRLPQPAGCGDKYDVSGFGYSRMFSAFCMFFNKYPSPDTFMSPSPSGGEGYGLLRCARNDGCSVGRSMVEMLGVLAIIAVLSVGGIAGYSKAMMKYKINKMISEYSYLIVSSLEYKDSLLKNNPKTGTIYLSSFFQDANLVPASWVMNGSLMVDSVGNNVQPYLNNSDGAEFIVMNVYLRTTSKGTADFAYNSCIALFNDIAKPLSEYFVGIFANSGSSSIHYDGTSSCHNEKSNFRCLTDMTLADADEACKKCLTNSNNCQVVMVW